MNIEQSIELLKSSAELRIDKADTQQKVNSANKFADAVNNIIDIHNKVQEYKELYTNAQKTLAFTLRIIGVMDYDIERLVAIDSRFLQYHLIKCMYNILKRKEEEPNYTMSEKWIFHSVVTLWDILQSDIEQIQVYQKLLKTTKNEETKTIFRNEIDKIESQIRIDTDYSDIEEMENYIKTW